MIYAMNEQPPRGNIFKKVLAIIACAGFLVWFANAALDAMVAESEWRADRMCRIYDICDPTRGP